jgi:hypothetical protein
VSCPGFLAVVPLSLALTFPSARVDGLNLEELGTAYLKLHCGKKAEPGSCTLEDVVQRDYSHLRLGAFDLAIPALDLAETDTAEDFRTIAVGLLDLQNHFTHWQEVSPELRKSLDEDFGKHAHLGQRLDDTDASPPGALR